MSSGRSGLRVVSRRLHRYGDGPARRYGDGPGLLQLLEGGAVAAGSGSVLQGLASVYDTLEVRTSVTPPAVVNLHAAATDSGPPNPIVEFLKPTIVLSGPSGQETIAPYGIAPDGTAGTIGVVAFLMGMGFALGYFVRSRKKG